MRYVIYLRVSTDQQSESGQGLDLQETACRAWLRSHRYGLAEVITDAGKSGAADVAARPGLARALALLAADKADGIVVHRLDRLARDLVLQETVLADLHRQGKQLRSCSPAEDGQLLHDPDDPTRKLTRQILGAVAAYERDVIRLRLRAGRVRKGLHGGYAGGAPPYGWAAVGGQLVKVPAEQTGIRLMTRLADDGVSYRQIAATLEAKGIRSRADHGRWRPMTILEIVRRARERAPRPREAAAS